jgi:hypothetical protein
VTRAYRVCDQDGHPRDCGVEAWSDAVQLQLARKLTVGELRDHVPSFLDELAVAVLVRLSGFEIVSLGVSLGEHGNGVSLFAGDQWLDEQTVRPRRAAAWYLAHACAPPANDVCQ